MEIKLTPEEVKIAVRSYIMSELDIGYIAYDNITFTAAVKSSVNDHIVVVGDVSATFESETEVNQ